MNIADAFMIPAVIVACGFALLFVGALIEALIELVYKDK